MMSGNGSEQTSNGLENGNPPVFRQESAQSTLSKIPTQTFLQSIFSWRALMALHMHCVMVMFVLLRLNMPIALVCMIQTPFKNASTSEHDVTSQGNVSFAAGELQPGERSTSGEDAVFVRTTTVQNSVPAEGQREFQWESSIQGLILTSTNMLGFVMPLFTDQLSHWMGAKLLLLLGMTTCGVLTLLHPLAARLSPFALIAIRVVIGLVGGMGMPVVTEVFSWWAPENEKVSMITFAYAGINVGNIVVSFITAYLCSIPIDNGWPFIFYVQGALVLLWCVMWQLFGSVRPEDHAFISEDEKLYISRTRLGMDQNQKRSSPPYKTILKSVPVWAFIGVMLCHYFASNILFSYIPMYLTNVFDLSVEKVGLFTSVFYLARFMGALAWGQITNLLCNKCRLGLTATRKLVQCSGFYTCTVALLALGFVAAMWPAMCILLVVLFAQSSVMSSGIVTPLDIAPRYAGFLIGLFLTTGIIFSLPGPILVSLMTTGGTLEEWRNVFILMGLVYFAGSTCYLLLAKSELQTWAVPTDSNPAKERENPALASADMARRLTVMSVGPTISPAVEQKSLDFTLTISPPNVHEAAFSQEQSDSPTTTIADNFTSINNDSATNAFHRASWQETVTNGAVPRHIAGKPKASPNTTRQQQSANRRVDDKKPDPGVYDNQAFEEDSGKDTDQDTADDKKLNTAVNKGIAVTSRDNTGSTSLSTPARKGNSTSDLKKSSTGNLDQNRQGLKRRVPRSEQVLSDTFAGELGEVLVQIPKKNGDEEKEDGGNDQYEDGELKDPSSERSIIEQTRL